MTNTQLPVNETVLRATIQRLESESEYGSLQDLYKEVAKHYNRADEVPEQVTGSIVGRRIKELEIELQTKPGKSKGGRGKEKLPIDREIVERLIAEVEADENFTGGLTGAYRFIADRYSEEDEKIEVSSSVIQLRCKEWDIKPNVAAGRRGREKRQNVNFNKTNGRKIMKLLCDNMIIHEVDPNENGFTLKFSMNIEEDIQAQVDEMKIPDPENEQEEETQSQAA